MEVSRSSLVVDLEVKAGIYAAAGVGEYWVIDVEARVAHVLTGPTATGYAGARIHRDGPLTSTTEPPFTIDLEAVLPAVPA